MREIGVYLKMRTKKSLWLFLLLGILSCSDEGTTFDLNGKWVATESFGLQFIEFYSKNEGRFGLYSKDFKNHEDFNYRLFDNKIAIDFINDSEGETIHNLTFNGEDKIEISGLTVIPENPPKSFSRYNIVTEKINGEIALGINDIFFDFDTGIRLKGYQINESRCPEDVVCVWQGYASARFNLIVDANFEYIFDLATDSLSPELKNDTLISGLKYTLLDIKPYPKLGEEFKPEDYTLIVAVE